MDRLGRIRAQLTERGLDGLIIFRPENRRYMSGFTGSSGVLLVTQQDALLFTDFRYVEQATAQAPKFTVLKHAQVMWDSVAEHTGGLSTLGFEQDFVSFELHELLTKKFPGCKLVPASGIVETLRSIK
ncbi:MAG TPA: aminopeptidase P family N-terminal domain-containing protein, partial [Verrucomicrobiae bacterium]|nr:aminopeptidase P family N-terminal domain-containing protein [Verrucomicrobiae bacterium]